MSPTEYETEGYKHKIFYAFHKTPFGKCLIGILQNKEKAICHLTFVDGSESEALSLLTKRWNRNDLIQETKETQKYVDKVFSGSPPVFSDNSQYGIYIVLKGTEFQIRVLEELAKVPPGSTTTYEKIAQAIGKLNAIRAVANAMGNNKIGYLIPCHRVFGKNGSNKYEWGVERKYRILEFEKKSSM